MTRCEKYEIQVKNLYKGYKTTHIVLNIVAIK